MKYRQLGRSGLQVSRLCLGTMNFGGPTAEPEAAHIVELCRDLGINFIDTAACSFYGLGVVPYSPLAHGVLSGKYGPNTPPPEGSRAARGDTRMLEAEWRPESLEIASKLAAHVAARGLTLGQFATAWVLRNPAVTSVIAGPRTAAQLHDYAQALDVALTAEDELAVDALVPPGHNAVHGFIDPAEPIEGRALA